MINIIMAALLCFDYVLILLLSSLLCFTFEHKHHRRNLNTGQSSEANVDCSPSLNISCYSSCAFTSLCWGIDENPDSYIYCSWNDLQPNAYIYTAYLQARNDVCYPDVKCTSSEYSVDAAQQNCHTYIYSNVTECEFVTKFIKVPVYFSVTAVHANHDHQCTSYDTFEPCDIVKLDPPIFQQIREMEDLIIEVEQPKCSKDSWCRILYNLRYSTFNGISESKENFLTNAPFNLHIYDSVEYHFSLSAAVEDVPSILRIWSDPSNATYLSRPLTSTDHQYVDFHCLVQQNKSSLIAKWQKTGIVDNFTCVLSSNLNIIPTSKIVIEKDDQSQTVFEAEFENFDLDVDYTLSIEAANGNGAAPTTTVEVSKLNCNSLGRNPTHCQKSSSAFQWTLVTWSPPASDASYTGVSVRTYSQFGDIMSKAFSPKTTQYNVTNLQTCVLYTHQVLSLYGDITVGSCSFQTFTQEIEPKAFPQFEVVEINATWISIHVNVMSDAESCGGILYYKIQMSGQESMLLTTSNLTLDGLRPYTTYQLQMSVVNSAGEGPFSPPFNVTTDQSAPSTPRMLSVVRGDGSGYRVEWKDPYDLNGVLSNFIMQITPEIRSATNSSDVTCLHVYNVTKCMIGAERHRLVLELSDGSKIEMQACTDKGNKCSVMSLPVYTPTYDDVPAEIWIALACAILLIITSLIAYIYISRSLHYKVKKPYIHPQVLKDFFEPGNDNRSDFRLPAKYKAAATLKCDLAGQENYDSVEEWRQENWKYSKGETRSEKSLETAINNNFEKNPTLSDSVAGIEDSVGVENRTDDEVAAKRNASQLSLNSLLAEIHSFHQELCGEKSSTPSPLTGSNPAFTRECLELPLHERCSVTPICIPQSKSDSASTYQGSADSGISSIARNMDSPSECYVRMLDDVVRCGNSPNAMSSEKLWLISPGRYDVSEPVRESHA